jgi:hypothetical protein
MAKTAIKSSTQHRHAPTKTRGSNRLPCLHNTARTWGLSRRRRRRRRGPHGPDGGSPVASAGTCGGEVGGEAGRACSRGDHNGSSCVAPGGHRCACSIFSPGRTIDRGEAVRREAKWAFFSSFVAVVAETWRSADRHPRFSLIGQGALQCFPWSLSSVSCFFATRFSCYTKKFALTV